MRLKQTCKGGKEHEKDTVYAHRAGYAYHGKCPVWNPQPHDRGDRSYNARAGMYGALS